MYVCTDSMYQVCDTRMCIFLGKVVDSMYQVCDTRMCIFLGKVVESDLSVYHTVCMYYTCILYL